MRALVVTEPGKLAVEERAGPVAGEGDILVRPVLVGVCGTDLDIVDGTIDAAFVRYPLVLGHEWTGVVESRSDFPGVPTVGSRVVVEGVIPCGHCVACAAGDTNRCETYDEIGFTRDGVVSEFVSVPARLVHGLSAEVTAESAVLVEPASVVMQALLRVVPVPGSRVLVIGDGTVGLLATCLVRLWSPASVTLLGVRPEQQPLATAAGANTFITSGTVEAGSYDLVIEAAGAVGATRTALAAPRRGGTVVLLGYPGQGVDVPLRVDDVVNNDLTIVGSFSYTSHAWRRVVDLLNSGQLDLGFLVTHRFPLADWRSALDAVRSGTGMRAKVLLDLSVT